MIRFDDHRPPLWMELANRSYGSDLTSHELLMEDLDDRPSRGSLTPPRRPATGRRVLLPEDSAGVDTAVAPSFKAPAADSPCLGGGPTSSTKETTR